MRTGCGAAAAVLLGVQLVACTATTAPSADRDTPSLPSSSKVVIREDVSRHFIALIGLKRQDDPPYLGTPNTNFSCLRSFIDRRTGATTYQLYVAASYDRNHDWDAAYDTAGRTLTFLPISRLPIACRNSVSGDCSYAEEFAAKFPESELRDNPRGFSISFTDKAADKQTVTVSADQIAAQLAAVAEQRRSLQPPAAQ